MISIIVLSPSDAPQCSSVWAPPCGQRKQMSSSCYICSSPKPTGPRGGLLLCRISDIFREQADGKRSKTAWKLNYLLLLSHFSRVRLLATPWTAVYQAPPSMGFSRQEYWSGLPLPSPCSLQLFVQNNPPTGSIPRFHYFISVIILRYMFHYFSTLTLLYS